MKNYKFSKFMDNIANIKQLNWNGESQELYSFKFKLNKAKIENLNNVYLLHKAFVIKHLKTRNIKASSKTRAEVSGGGKKPWKQKKTGRARAGSIRSPLWKGGGVVFGPKSRMIEKKINHKEWKLALNLCLLKKSKDMIIVKDLMENFIDKPSTKLLCMALKRWKINLNEKILIIIEKNNYNLFLSSRNLPNVKLINADSLNLKALLAANKIILSANALNIISNIYQGI